MKGPSGAARDRSAPELGPWVFDLPPGYGCSPQIRRLSCIHTLGIAKLSRLYPQAVPDDDRHPSSEGCGFVDNCCPQGVDNYFVHRTPPRLSTGHPQVEGGFPQRDGASPHPCPLFGNTTRSLTGSSERRHTEVPDWAVGNRGKAGDSAGENYPHLCIRCAQLSPVHREPGLSTISAHRVGGQKTASELRKRGYPLYPQPLLLLPTRVTGKSASKWVLCTTRLGRLRSRRARLDHDRHLLSVGCVRLVPGVLPLPGPDDTETTADEPVAGPTAGRPLTGRERPATAGGGLT